MAYFLIGANRSGRCCRKRAWEGRRTAIPVADWSSASENGSMMGRQRGARQGRLVYEPRLEDRIPVCEPANPGAYGRFRP